MGAPPLGRPGRGRGAGEEGGVRPDARRNGRARPAPASRTVWRVGSSGLTALFRPRLTAARQCTGIARRPRLKFVALFDFRGHGLGWGPGPGPGGGEGPRGPQGWGGRGGPWAGQAALGGRPRDRAGGPTSSGLGRKPRCRIAAAADVRPPLALRRYLRVRTGPVSAPRSGGPRLQSRRSSSRARCSPLNPVCPS